MLETLYAQLITDPNTQKVIVETDRTGATIETIYIVRIIKLQFDTE